MSTDYDAENVQLIEIENEVLRGEVGRHRQNVERLVEMLTAVTDERDHLRRQIAATGQTGGAAMIGESLPDQHKHKHKHKQRISELSAQINHIPATGHRIELVPAGKSGEIPFTAIGNHPKNLKARRDKHEPRVRELAAAGNTASPSATAIGIDSRTVRRIAKEHNITLAEPT